MNRILFTLLFLASLSLSAQEATRENTPPPVEGKAAASQGPVELPGASVIGNQELPIGLDIVPWRPGAAGEVNEGPTQLLDAPLEPIDPEVFRRELSIYQNNPPAGGQ